MKYFKSINEFLGVETPLYDLALQIIDKLEDNRERPVKIIKDGTQINILSACQIKTKIREKDITINLQLGDRAIGGFAAFVAIEDFDNYIFNLYTSILQVPTIVHELKHISRISAFKFDTSQYYFLNFVGKDVVEHCSHLFSNKESGEFLKDCFYFFDPEEFEAHYNQIYHLLKSKIKPEMNLEEKRLFIGRLLKTQKVYYYYSFFYKTGFKLEDFFKSNSAANEFTNILVEKIENDKNDEYENWSNINTSSNFDDDEELNSVVKEINKLYNSVITKGFKKFHRFYSIFL